MIGRYGRSDNAQGIHQVLITLVPYAFLWWLSGTFGRTSWYVLPLCVPLLILFTLRVFALMHECGHRSLFRSVWLNRWTGFVLGVLSGMPQYVWAQHHNYHHANNGNWERYRGPYATLSVDEYAALNSAQQRFYRHKCSIAASPLAGFIYLILNPRLTPASRSLRLNRRPGGRFVDSSRNPQSPAWHRRSCPSSCASPLQHSPWETAASPSQR